MTVRSKYSLVIFKWIKEKSIHNILKICFIKRYSIENKNEAPKCFFKRLLSFKYPE